MAYSFNIYPPSTSAIASHDVMPSSTMGCKATNGSIAAEPERGWTSSVSSLLEHQEQVAANGTGSGQQPAPVRTLSISRSGRFKSKSKQRARLSVDQIEPLTLAAEAIASGDIWMNHERPTSIVSAITSPTLPGGLVSGEVDRSRDSLQRPVAPPTASAAGSLKSASVAGCTDATDARTRSIGNGNDSHLPHDDQHEVGCSTPPAGFEIAFESTSL